MAAGSWQAMLGSGCCDMIFIFLLGCRLGLRTACTECAGRLACGESGLMSRQGGNFDALGSHDRFFRVRVWVCLRSLLLNNPLCCCAL